MGQETVVLPQTLRHASRNRQLEHLLIAQSNLQTSATDGLKSNRLRYDVSRESGVSVGGMQNHGQDNWCYTFQVSRVSKMALITEIAFPGRQCGGP